MVKVLNSTNSCNRRLCFVHMCLKCVNYYIRCFCVAYIRSQLHIQCEEAEQHVTAKVSFSVQPEINLRCQLRTNEVRLQ